MSRLPVFAPAARVGPTGPRSGAAPRHVAIIMDGNGRWAKRRHLPRIAGHRSGAEAVRRTVRAAAELGLDTLTLYAFSSENWRRPAEEIGDLMGLLRHFLKAELTELAEGGIRLQVIGDYRSLDTDLVAMIDDAIARTEDNRRLRLVIALNYGSQAEICGAVRQLAEAARRGELDPATIDTHTIEALLDTRDLPPLDLLIRTSGEQRLSNFLLWQAAYAELMFVDTLWPDFDGETLVGAVNSYVQRERRYGGL